MQFRAHQAQARQRARQLIWRFGFLVLALVLIVNVVLALGYRTLFPFTQGFPSLFFETNTGLVLLLVLGGCWLESDRLQSGGGVRVAHWMHARQLTDPDSLIEKRLFHVAEELALSAKLPRPLIFILEREHSINAFTSGWDENDAVLVVTRGALDRLSRQELQGLIAHEYGHIREGDVRVNMRLLSLVWGLSLLHSWGQAVSQVQAGAFQPLFWVFGTIFRGLGWLGWLAGQLLQASVSRQHEYGADACAVELTRDKDGIANTLRKIWHQFNQQEHQLQHPQANALASMWLYSHIPNAWFQVHPPLPQRLQRLLGHTSTPLPSQVAPHLEASASTTGLTAAQHNEGFDFSMAQMANVAPMRTPLPIKEFVLQQSGQKSVETASGAAPSPMATQTLSPQDISQATKIFQASLSRSATDRSITDRRAPDQSILTHDALNPVEQAAREALQTEAQTTPQHSQAVIFALLLTPDQPQEQAFWTDQFRSLPQAHQLLAHVRTLSRHSRLPLLSFLLEQCLYTLSLSERQALVKKARDLISADGLVRPLDRLQWLWMRQVLGPEQLFSHAGDLGDAGPMHWPSLDLMSRQQIAVLTAYLARLVPAPPVQGQVAAVGMKGLGLSLSPPGEGGAVQTAMRRLVTSQ